MVVVLTDARAMGVLVVLVVLVFPDSSRMRVARRLTVSLYPHRAFRLRRRSRPNVGPGMLRRQVNT